MLLSLAYLDPRLDAYAKYVRCIFIEIEADAGGTSLAHGYS